MAIDFLAASKTLQLSVKIIFINFFDDMDMFEGPIEIYREFYKTFVEKKAFINVLFIDVFGDKMRRRRHSSQNGEIKFMEIPSVDTKFPIVKKSDEGFNTTVQVLQFDDLPFTSVSKGKILGVSGKLIDTFCAKYNLSYKVVNNQSELVTSSEFDRVMLESDISLFTLTTRTDDSKFNTNIPLNIIDGICVLVPINIPVDSNQNSPFDYQVIILFVCTIFTIIFLWFFISKRSKSKFSFSFVLISVYKLILGRDFEREHVMNRKEKLLLYSFMFGNIFLINLYQSWLISLMLSKPLMRSIQSIQELNDSNTQIATYSDASPIRFRDKIIRQRIDIAKEAISFGVPDNFNHDLAYVVCCRYAEFFMRSRKNMKGNEKIFRIIPEKLASFPLTYKASRRFVLAEKFRFITESLTESGIKDQWTREMTDGESSDSNEQGSESETFLKDVTFAFVILGIGSSVASASFILEIIVHRLNQFTKISQQSKNVQKHRQASVKQCNQIELETLQSINDF